MYHPNINLFLFGHFQPSPTYSRQYLYEIWHKIVKTKVRSQESESESDLVICNADSGVGSRSRPFEKPTPESSRVVAGFQNWTPESGVVVVTF